MRGLLTTAACGAIRFHASIVPQCFCAKPRNKEIIKANSLNKLLELILAIMTIWKVKKGDFKINSELYTIRYEFEYMKNVKYFF